MDKHQLCLCISATMEACVIVFLDNLHGTYLGLERKTLQEGKVMRTQSSIGKGFWSSHVFSGYWIYTGISKWKSGPS